MKRDLPRLLLSDRKGRIFSHPALQASGMEAGHLFRLKRQDLIKLPPASRLFMMPGRIPAGFAADGDIEMPEDKFFAVGAHLAPGYTALYSPAYRPVSKPGPLPLFSYAAIALYKGDIHASCIRVDKDPRHDARFIDMARVRRNIARYRKIFTRNRLVRHLERCALVYGCPNAQNFFLARYECPLPTSPSCNASCAGCISFQGSKSCPASQPRIKFIPYADEVGEIALFHIENVKDPVVSFGQGCEGEPLLAADLVEESIRYIRRRTSKGTINMNTNASRSDTLRRLFDAGLDSIRVSMNSAREMYYTRYYKPRGYSFRDVLRSIAIAKGRGRFVSVNYLTMPGFTDIEEEFAAFKAFVRAKRIDMVQWRNLNFDPLLYFKELGLDVERDKLIGIRQVITSLKKIFPNLMMGYFNPSRGAASPRR